MEIKGKTALVTGAAKRVGRVIALTLAKKGASILLHYNHSEKDAQDVKKEIEKEGVTCTLLKADLEKEKDVRAMIAEIEKKSIPVSILVNSASIFSKTPIDTVTAADFDKFISVNLKAPFLLSVELGKKMRASSGRILNIADWSGFRPYKDYMPYCISKGGLLTMTKALAKDLAPHVIVNAIAPGPVMKPADLSEEENQAAIKKTLLGRWGTPEDIANACVFLLENDFINGTVLVVDGGRSIV